MQIHVPAAAGARAAIKNHKDWFAHQELVKARDVHVKNNPSLGDSAVNNREAARYVSASTPFAGKAFDVRIDGTYATALSSDTLQDELQRKLGLWLSVALPTLRVALGRGMPVDFFGDYLYNKAHHAPPAAPRRRPRRLGGRDARPGQRAGRAR